MDRADLLVGFGGEEPEITHGAGQFTDRLLALCQGIKIVQMPILITATYRAFWCRRLPSGRRGPGRVRSDAECIIRAGSLSEALGPALGRNLVVPVPVQTPSDHHTNASDEVHCG